MTTLASEIITKVRFRLDDETDQSIGDTEITHFANDGAREFSSTTGVIQDTSNINSDNSAFTFNILSGLTNWVNIFAVNFAGNPLIWQPRYEIREVYGANSGTPTKWSIWGDLLYLDKIAPAASGADAINVFYTRYSANMDTSDTSSVFDFPDKWLPAILSYAQYRVLDSDRDDGLADRAKSEYDSLRKNAALINEAVLQGGGYSR